MPFATDKASDLDDARLSALLEMAGQDLSGELARRLVSDFDDVARALQQQGGALDRQTIRTQSHILMSLAGTIGAARLTEAAQQLNRLAHGGDGDGLRQVLDLTMRQLLGLLPLLSARLARHLGQP